MADKKIDAMLDSTWGKKVTAGLRDERIRSGHRGPSAGADDGPELGALKRAATVDAQKVDPRGEEGFSKGGKIRKVMPASRTKYMKGKR